MSSDHVEKTMKALSELSDFLQPTTKEIVLKNLDYNKNFQQSSKIEQIDVFISNYLKTLKDLEHNWKLPRTSIPISYDLHLKSNIHSGSLAVEGEVTIRLRVVERTDAITLHSRNLNIKDLKVFAADGFTEVPIIKFSLYEPTDMLTVYLAEETAADLELNLVVSYQFTMNDSPVQTGFYRTSYISSAGTRR